MCSVYKRLFCLFSLQLICIIVKVPLVELEAGLTGCLAIPVGISLRHRTRRSVLTTTALRPVVINSLSLGWRAHAR